HHRRDGPSPSRTRGCTGSRRSSRTSFVRECAPYWAASVGGLDERPSVTGTKQHGPTALRREELVSGPAAPGPEVVVVDDHDPLRDDAIPEAHTLLPRGLVPTG